MSTLRLLVAWLVRPAERPGRPFKLLTLATLLSIFALIVVGGVVRVTNSGLGCPDWPLCHGRIIPPLEFATLIEYSHRLVAVLASVLTVATMLLAVLRYRGDRWILVPSLAGLALLLFQVVLGGVTVLTELSPEIVVSHLAVAQAYFAAFIVVAVAAHRHSRAEEGQRQDGHYVGLAVAVAASVYAVLLSGSYQMARGAMTACPDWPLCNGSIFPGTELQAIHMAHRYVVAASAVLALGLAYMSWRVRRSDSRAFRGSLHLLIALVAQALIGAANIWYDFTAGMRALHLAVSSVVWAAAVLLVVRMLRPGAPTGETATRTGERPSRVRNVVGDYVKLAKPKIVLLLLVTALGGMVLAEDGMPGAGVLLATLAGVGLAAGGANAINQYLERDIDGQMVRTRRRPLPSGRMPGRDALAYGVVLNVLAFGLMAAWVNLVAAVLTLAGTLFYVLVYTMWLKRSTVQNIVIGGAAGAIPPLVGWAAVSGSVGLPAWYLFAIVFFWTPPHFWALALLLQRDYAVAGVPMLPVVYGADETRRHILLYSLVLAGVTLLMAGTGAVGWPYVGSAIVLNAAMVYYSLRLTREGTVAAARRLYLFSLLYLALLFAALIADRLVA